MVMKLHKLTAGDGYTYLLRNVAAQDATHPGRTSLNDYYSEKGEAPGRWYGRGLESLTAPAGLHANLDALRVKEVNGETVDLWTIKDGEQVTEDQMKALFGLGVHPNSKALTTALESVGASPQAAVLTTRLGRPFHVNPAETEMSRRLAVAYRDHNLSIGARWNADLDADIAAQIKTGIGIEMFADEYGRAPADDRELGGYIARNTRKLTTSVSGFDLTFTPVKSVSVLWALAPRGVAETIERCHDAAVSEVLDHIQDEACFTRTGAQGVAQVDTDGLIAARFTHRDSRAGDPNLHTHVAVSAKVRHTKTIHGAQVSQWLALDGRPLYTLTVAASELYNTRMEHHVSAALGLRFADRGDAAAGKREIREVAGIPQNLIDGFSSRRAEIEQRTDELAKQFQVDHGREPTATESIRLAQQATLETREAKHEPRSLAEQKQQWHTQAVELLGSNHAVNTVLADALEGRAQPAAAVTADWIAQHAGVLVDTIMGSRSTWQYHHVFAEAQRIVRANNLTGHAALADHLTAAALSEPHSIAQQDNLGGDLGEPIHLRRRDGSSVYRIHRMQPFTSHQVLAAERRIMHSASLGGGHVASADDVEFALLAQTKTGRPLNAGQTALVREMARSGKHLMLGLAPAGSGKTTAMSALARAWEKSGGTVIGLSPSASAAQLLRNEIGIDVADTVDKFNWLSDNPAPGDSEDSARDWFDSINESTLLIVDEAGKAGTLALDTLISTVLARGASVRLIGDDRQLGSIAAGGVLRDLAETTGAVTLSQIMRFSSASEAQALSALRIGDPAGLAFYADHHRIHVGANATAADMAFHAWCADADASRDSLLIAPTHDITTTLNDMARQRRLDNEARTNPANAALHAREVALAGGSRASVGDVIITKTNDRRLRLSTTDFVRNGYRWTITAVNPDGSLTATHTESNLVMQLPAEYVATSVRLGYAITIDAAQGATARYRCHTVGGDGLSRQQVYTALSRGVHENHIYLSTAEDDPHRILHPKATHPDTAIDALTRALARDDSQVSATTAARRATDPMRTLGDNVARYADAVGTAAETLLTADESAAIDANANTIYPGLTDCAAWPVLRKNLAVIGANNHNPLRRLAAAAARGELDNAADPAAVLDWRLDPSGAHSGGAGPLPWLPAQPARVRTDDEWASYLDRRASLIADQVGAIRESAATWTTATAPVWARPLIAADPELVADLAVFRAATKVDDVDTRLAGPQLYADRVRAAQSALEQRAAELIGNPDSETSRWNSLVDTIDQHVRKDPYWPQLAAHLASIARTGVDVRQIIAAAAEQGPLPDELPAAALWWRIAGALSPAAVEVAHPDLRPDWLPDLEAVIGTDLAETIAADPAFPALVSAISAADPARWTPRELLTLAVEHLRDVDAGLTHHLRPDEHARLLTYTVDLFAAGHTFDHDDIPLPDHPPTELDLEELPLDPLAHDQSIPPADLNDPDTLLRALGLLTDDEPPTELEGVPLDPLDHHHGDFGDLAFDDLATTRHVPALADLNLALADVRWLRGAYAGVAADIDHLTRQIADRNGPAVQAVLPGITDMRERADADRPYLAAIEQVLAEWSDADAAHETATAVWEAARAELATLRAAGADELDIASAQRYEELTRMALGDRSPAERYFDALTEARRRREAAAGGPDNILTHADVDTALAAAAESDRRRLAAARTKLAALNHALHRSEAATARAFAHANTRTSEHITNQLDTIATELDVLDRAGEMIPTRYLRLPVNATANLSPATADAITKIAASPFTITAVRASDHPATTADLLARLAAAAEGADRPVLWLAPADPDRAATAADPIDPAVLRDQLHAGPEPLPANSVVIIDHADHVTPEVIADLAAAANDSGARLILISPEHDQWPPAASSALLNLLHTDLPWSVNLPTDSTIARRNIPGRTPDLRAAITQAADLDPQLRTPDIAAALRRHNQLRDYHRESAALNDQLNKAGQRRNDRGPSQTL